ncbi:MAG: MmcQ/YjbR family DNA-binding protein [Sporomusa sp.]
MKKRELIDYCLTFPFAFEDYPFDNFITAGAWTVMRHTGNQKSFALIYERNEKLCINLKCEPMRADFLRQMFIDVAPGYHMNKTHWNTVTLDGDVPAEHLYDMIQHSFDLTKPKERKPK